MKMRKSSLVRVIVSLTEIHEFTPIYLQIESAEQFIIAKWRGQAIRVLHGYSPSMLDASKAAGIVSQPSNSGLHLVEMEIMEWIRIRYDVFFFPYMCGIVEGYVHLPNKFIWLLEFHIPQNLRTIWYLSDKAYGSIGVSHPKVHSPEKGKVRYFYFFPYKDQKILNETVYLRVVVRLSGAELLHWITLPLAYAILVAATLALLVWKVGPLPEFTVGIPSGFVVFLTQRLAKYMPQRQTLLLHYYIVLTVGLVLWVWVWAALGHKALWLVPFYIFGVWQILRAHIAFSRTGKLPNWVEKYMLFVMALDRSWKKRLR